MVANRPHVRYEFINKKIWWKNLVRIEASSICRQVFANVFAGFFVLVAHTNLSLLTQV